MTAEEQVYSALKNSTRLTSLLAGGANGIYNGQSPDAGTYPVVVFRLLSASPALHGDGNLLAYRATIRVTVITGNGANAEIRQAVYDAMVDCGFCWLATNKTYDNGECYLTIDFSYVREI